MFLQVNLDDPTDIRAAIEELKRRLAPSVDVNERFVDDVLSRIGKRMTRLVWVVAHTPGWLTIHSLAEVLNRPWQSVKSSLNGPLSTAIKSARTAIPGAPNHLFEWKKPGEVYEFRVRQELLELLLQRLPEDGGGDTATDDPDPGEFAGNDMPAEA